MIPRPGQRLAALGALLAIAAAATAQQQAAPPQIGYVYPAGGKAGADVLVTVGGRNLAEASGARWGGEGLRAVVQEQIKLPNGKEVQALRDELKELQARAGRGGGPKPQGLPPNPAANRPRARP